VRKCASFITHKFFTGEKAKFWINERHNVFASFYELDLSDFVYMLCILSFLCAVQDDSLFLAMSWSIELHVCLVF